jgi:glycosyltransferase involved in cell wall biosynthesis
VVAGKKAFDGMTVLTSGMKQGLCDDFHIEPDHIGVWTSGVSQEIFAPEKYDHDELRRERSWADRFVIMYHGVFAPNRGLIESIRAIKIAGQQCPNLFLFLLGSGPLLESMKTLVSELNLEKNVEFHVPVPYERVPSFIAASDVGIVPPPDLAIWRNQSPLKLMEYLAMKKVVLMTDLSFMRDVVGENKCGVYFSTSSPEEISNSMIYVYKNREKLGEWGRIGRKIVEEKYTWAKVAKNLESYLLQL